MYSVGDRVKYHTIGFRSSYECKESIEKIGIIEEAFTTVDGRPCYWIEDEQELILEDQIAGKVN